ncbi:MAG TPA: translocation/assembly module TamB domain-containing protein [Candidatus Binatia bacterium]|jgi:translocation and assembly module TamB|nr:translocation/assembly module TamB domain-containing protein [Candidatus Binatia bacterium]
MPLGKRQRRILQGLGLALGCVLLLWFSLPLWFPWLLRPLARKAGVHYTQYARKGYARFDLSGLSFSNATVRFRAERIEALAPNVWLWRCLTTPQQQPFLSAQNWQFESIPAGSPSGSSSVYSNVQRVAATLKTLNRWLPTAVLSNGVVRVKMAALPVVSLTWTQGELTAVVRLPHQAGPAILHGTSEHPPVYQVDLTSAALHLRTRLDLSTSASGLEVRGTSDWWSNRVELRAQFGPSDTLPATARLDASGVHLPGELLRLPQYRDINGSVTAEWEHGNFTLDLAASSRPPDTQSNLPPLQLGLHADGDTHTAIVHTATLSAPGLSFELSQELKLYFSGPLLREPASLKVTAELARLPQLSLEGRLNGEARFGPGAGALPSAHFQLAGSDIGWHAFKAAAFSVEGSLDWPRLVVTKAEATFGHNSTATISGNLELETKTVTEGRLLFDGALASPWLPAGYLCQHLLLSMDFHGPLQAPIHSGHLEATDFTSPSLQPLQLHADWKGQRENLEDISILAGAGESSVLARGSFTNGPTQVELRLAQLSLSTNRQPVLELARPARISLSQRKPPDAFSFATTPFDWVGTAGELHAHGSVEWPSHGELQLSIEKLSSTLFASFSRTKLPVLEVHHLDASAAWTNGPVTIGIDLSATGNFEAPGTATPAANPASPAIPIQAELLLRGNANGLNVSNLVVNSRTSTVAVAHGFLPLALIPSASSNLVQLNFQQPLQFSAAARPQAFFWDQLTKLTGVQVSEPKLDMNVSGTWASPRGEVNLSVRQIQFKRATATLPTLEELHVTLQLDRERASLTDGHWLIQGQPVSLTGELPLGQSFWTALREKKIPDFDKASAQLRIEDAKLAGFAPLLPEILAPQGEMTLAVSLLPGGKLDGDLEVRDARTRPIATAGPIRDIQVKMRFVERTLKLERATANVGGADLSMSGQAELRGTEWLRGALPPFEFTVRGADVPLARQPDFVLRSDLLLGVTKTNGASPLISGAANLRNSFYLSDLRALVPGKVASPNRRPPYFSTDDPALADWRLDVDVQGSRFLKVRSTLFNGEVSANLKLLGTLQDPVALGDLRIDSGVVRFPFASLQVQQGFVSLTSEDPYRPQLAVTALSKQFGYDIRMSITGPVDAPVIQFTSTPPLSSERILLMVTAGQLPQGAFTLTPEQKAQTVALFLGRDLLAKLGVGDQAQQRLTIHSGEEISEQGRPTYHVEYKLTERWSLEAEYDRFGDFNAGFKWRIYSK